MATPITNTPIVSPVFSVQRVPAPVLLPLAQTPFYLPRYPTPLALSRFPSHPSVTDLMPPCRLTHRLLPAYAHPPYPHPYPLLPRTRPTPARSSTPSRSPTPFSPLTDYDYEDTDIIKRPPHVGVSHVVSMFTLAYPEIDEQGREKEYARFRDCLDQLTTIHLDSSVALVFQDKDEMKALHDAMAKDFVWLERCPQNWPVSVCLQVKLHNLARNATNKSNKKVIAMVHGNRPPTTRKATHRRSRSSTPTAGPSRSSA
ncbi:hypothetical protein K438DRAFT_1997600 [Mycena galopus ATCC 62051]|nr:hypothetical protein K438DRAFT_1997600 [Mycena galopus ATCC 62051]